MPQDIKGFPGGTSGKEPACQGRRNKRRRLDPWVGKRYTGGGHGNTLQSSCLENPMDKGAWRATVTKSQTKQSDLTRIGHKKCNEINSREVGIKGPGIWGFSQTHKVYTASKAFFQRHSF